MNKLDEFSKLKSYYDGVPLIIWIMDTSEENHLNYRDFEQQATAQTELSRSLFTDFFTEIVFPENPLDFLIQACPLDEDVILSYLVYVKPAIAVPQAVHASIDYYLCYGKNPTPEFIEMHTAVSQLLEGEKIVSSTYSTFFDQIQIEERMLPDFLDPKTRTPKIKQLEEMYALYSEYKNAGGRT